MATSSYFRIFVLLHARDISVSYHLQKPKKVSPSLQIIYFLKNQIQIMRISNRFILKPDFHNLGKLGLDYKDLLTYITIRSFNNTKSKYCYPSYRAISKISGQSTNLIAKSIRRLREAGILTAWAVGKRRKAYWYAFDDVAGLYKVPYELLNDPDLTSHEKAILILLSEYCKDGFCAESVEEIAAKSSVSKRSLESQYETLLLKGYIAESMYEDRLSGTLTKHFTFTRKLNWSFKIYDNQDSPTDWVETMMNHAISKFRTGDPVQ